MSYKQEEIVLASFQAKSDDGREFTIEMRCVQITRYTKSYPSGILDRGDPYYKTYDRETKKEYDVEKIKRGVYKILDLDIEVTSDNLLA